MSVPGPAGRELELSRAESERILCDAIERQPDGTNRSVIPPRVRQKVLERDDGRCVICGSADCLDVHHRVPRSRGGSHEVENLVTLCRACHTLVHERGEWPGAAGPPSGGPG